MLNATNLACQFQEKFLFSSITFSLSPGECLQMTGENGCGKTSLLRILAGLRSPDEGHVLWKNQCISKIKWHYSHDRLHLGHKLGFKPDLTVLENIEYYHALYHLTGPLRELSFLSSLPHLPAKLLSSGQQKRLALMQLDISNAMLWILDEPFTNLDSQGIAWLQDKIQKHLEKKGMVIFTSHQKINFPVQLLELSLCTS